MSVRVFLDTNILVYAVDRAEPETAKRAKAREIIAQGSFGLSAQVLQEFNVTVTRKIKKPLSAARAARMVAELAKLPIVTTDTTLINMAIALSERYLISYWDGAIIAAAEALGAKTVYSEDLNHGQTYGSVRIENPFVGI